MSINLIIISYYCNIFESHFFLSLVMKVDEELLFLNQMQENYRTHLEGDRGVKGLHN